MIGCMEMKMSEFTQIEWEKRWQAIQTRDANWDGRLFYGVKTTGIYCRPSCPSKRPLIQSVEFFSNANEAEKAGYRPCKRCHPELWQNDFEEFTRLMQILQDQPGSVINVREWAAAAKVKPEFLQKMTRRFAGISARQLIIENRVNQFKREIHNGENITSSQFAAGYGSSSRLYEKAETQLGMTPGQYQKGGAGKTILYGLVDTPVGRMLIAATDRGVCSIRFGNSEMDLLSELRLEYFKAEIKPHTDELNPWIEQLHQYFAGSTHLLDIPLELQATTFQLLVWQELRKIPYGETRSYSQLARAVGKPAAARAVASACAANPIALINPCHRVIHQDGTISGYRWGLDRKRRLLALEQDSKKG